MAIVWSKHIAATNSELELVRKIRRWTGRPSSSGLVLGIGDDCAIYRARGSSEDLLFTTDMLLEEVHFRRDTHRAEDVGWKLSGAWIERHRRDGRRPAILLLSLAVGNGQTIGGSAGFYRGLLRLARREASSWLAEIWRVRRKGGVRYRRMRAVRAARRASGWGTPRAMRIYVLESSAVGVRVWRRERRGAQAASSRASVLELGGYLRGELHATAAMI